MIETNDIYLSLRDLVRKDHAGYFSSAEFNRVLPMASDVLFDFYIDEFDKTASIHEALDPFVRETFLTGGQYRNLPADYRQRIEAGVEEVIPSECGDTPETTIHYANYWKANEDLLSMQSTIRRPSVSKRRFAFQIVNGQVKIYPAINSRIYLKYLKNPVKPVRGFTVNVTTQEEEYDALTTTDLEWGAEEKSNIIDICLMYWGLLLKETPVIQWVMAKKPGLVPESVKSLKFNQNA